DWNDTKYNNPEFDALLLEARAETDLVKRKALYSKLAHIINEDGGAIVPMFNDFVEAHADTLMGWENNPNQEMMDGFVSHKTWFA
ncbi:MAG: peptide ABC transporter substrate-binding protein, partial [Pseudorhodobacter sp.]